MLGWVHCGLGAGPSMGVEHGWGQGLDFGAYPLTLAPGPGFLLCPLPHYGSHEGVRQGPGRGSIHTWNVYWDDCLRLRQSEATEAGRGLASTP